MIRRVLIDLRPYISVLLLVSTLFGLVLLKMEERRMGYAVLKSTQEIRRLGDQRRLMSMDYARLTRPGRVHDFALSHSTLTEAHKGQIIQLSGQQLALTQ